MKLFFPLLLALAAIFVGGSTVLAGMIVKKDRTADLVQAHSTDGAFRDGFYLGRLDRMTGRDQHLSAGRWSNPQDRVLFEAGYKAGYRTIAE